VRRVWLQVAFAALAGLGRLVVCSGALVAIVSLVISEGNIVGISSSLATTFFWFGLVNAILFAGASLSLPALALGARGGRTLTTTVLSSLVFGASVFFFLILDNTVSFPVPLTFTALVITAAMGSLVAVQEEEDHSVAVRLGRASVIAAVAIYCASLLAHWLVPGDTSPSYLAPYVVAAFSLPVLPAIVAMLRSG
jgi:hypothetical protein